MLLTNKTCFRVFCVMAIVLIHVNLPEKQKKHNNYYFIVSYNDLQ